jgi:26S proteasome regulatory subunit N6
VPDEITDDNVKAKEQATYKLANIYKEKGLIENLIDLQKKILPLFVDLPQSKTGKIIRTLFDMSTKIEGNYRELIDLCHHIIAWCDKYSRSFLRMRIENKLAELYFNMEKYHDALQILNKLLTELKKKEDKQLLVEA